MTVSNKLLVLCRNQVVILDGATGTELIKRGMGQGVSPELWCIEHPEAVNSVQNAYVAAGSHIVYAPTFGANRVKLAEFGRADDVREINRVLAQNCRTNLGKRCLLFGDMSPTGLFAEPFGDTKFEELVDIYKEQVAGLLAGGVDGFAIETMFDLQEARAALLAVKESCDLPVLVTMTFEASGRTLTGNTPLAALLALQGLGADAFGCNCSTGPEAMAKIMADLKPYAKIPLLAKPNAGLPQLQNDGRTVFSLGAIDFGVQASQLIDFGANLVGGCCGTTPEHIAELAKHAKTMTAKLAKAEKLTVISSSRRVCEFGPGCPTVPIGERINPTGKKELQNQLRNHDLSMVCDFAYEQQAAGAEVLDVNCGLSGIDEVATMAEIVMELSRITELPLCIDSTKPEVVEKALRLYPGRALLNSISAERVRLEKLLPVAAKYGALFIALPLADEGIAPTAEGRLAVSESIVKEAVKYGYAPAEMVIDPLIMTVSSDVSAPSVSLDVIAGAKARGYSAVCGLSNVSFGMPERKHLNAAMLTLAVRAGLDMAIVNPCDAMLMNTLAAVEALTGKDRELRRYIKRFTEQPSEVAANDILSKIKQAVHQGDANKINGLIAEALKEFAAGVIVEQGLIAAINQVGVWFEQKKYFLPQLVMSADAMRCGFDYLEPYLTKTPEAAAKAKIILATVEGDVHDIGKNIVGLMLKNYGFQVIDLGKDVAAAKILAAAKQENASMVGLSALMTTTMPRMREVVELFRQNNMGHIQFLIGGAVVDQNYADSIGAAYAADAMAAVKLAHQFSK